MKASSLSFLTAVVVALIGMAWGLHMAISQDHSTLTAHAHLNLLGWVSLFLFGVFYRLHPALDAARIARLQVLIWLAGTAILTIGVAIIHSGRPGGEPYAGVGAIMVFADMLLFGWLVLREVKVTSAV
jgi:hypothetical protein